MPYLLPFKVGIIGTRERDTLVDFNIVLEAFSDLSNSLGGTDYHIISGGCPIGADRFAERIAKDYSYPITIYYANWDLYGKRAASVRNLTIAQHSDYLIACVSKDRKGGTEMTIKMFIKHKGSDNNLILV